MVEFHLSASMPVLNADYTVDALKKAEAVMLASVQLNIMMGGRPPFKVKNKNNSTPLVGTGKMYGGLRSERGSDYAAVYMDKSIVSKTGFPYPQSLNDGADVPAVDGKLMVFEIDGHTVFTYHRKAYHRNAFPFMIFQEQDKQRILEGFAGSIFKNSITFSS
jgi:phage gpG-like protein